MLLSVLKVRTKRVYFRMHTQERGYKNVWLYNCDDKCEVNETTVPRVTKHKAENKGRKTEGQPANPNKIAMAILGTFLFRVSRCCIAMAVCSPEISFR